MVKTNRIIWFENGKKQFTRIPEDRHYHRRIEKIIEKADEGSFVTAEDEATALMEDVMAAESRVMPPRVRDLNALCVERLELSRESRYGKISAEAFRKEDKRLLGLIKQFHLDNSRIMPK